MTRKKTHEEFKNEINVKFNNSFTCLTFYKGINDRIRVKHQCGYEFEVVAKYLLKYGKCKKCSDIKKGKKRRRKHEDFIKKVEEIHGKEYKVLTEYKTVKDKVKVKHIYCEEEYFVRPDSLLRGSKCSKCVYRKYSKENKKTTKEYKIEVEKTTQGKYSIVSNYKGVREKIKIRHNECKHEFFTTPFSFNRGLKCPNCNYYKGEKTVEDILKSMNLKYETQKKFKDLKNINSLSYDFYLPKYNILIEYQGKQHYEPIEFFGGQKTFIKQQKNDKIKREYALKNNLYLLEIPYTKFTFEDIEEEIKEKLSNVKQGVV